MQFVESLDKIVNGNEFKIENEKFENWSKNRKGIFDNFRHRFD
jgi:hypothetical protein